MTTREGINSILKIVGLAGLGVTIIVAPNALQALDILLRKRGRIKQFPKNRVLVELKRQKLIEISTQAGGRYAFQLTPAGAKRLQQLSIDELKIPRQKPWDKNWRIVTFDIPVKQSTKRAYFTTHLRHLDFFMLQRSFWVHPFPCFKELEQIAGYYDVLRYCSFLETAKIDGLSARKLLRNFQPLLH